MSEIAWGIIGCGNVTEKKSGQAYNKVPHSSLVAVMRRNEKKAADYARRHNVQKWYADADALLSDPRVNAVSIATPPAFHLSYAVDALERGLNVYVEKPVTRNAAEAEAMAAAVRRTGGRLTVAHYRRALPMFLYVRELLEAETIGAVRTVQIRMWKTIRPDLIASSETDWRVHPELSGGGYFHDLAPHQLDLMLFYFGKPVRYHGFSLNQSATYPADDHVSGQILFENQVVVNGSWCFNVAESQVQDSCEIIGSKGRIRFPFFGTTVSWENEVSGDSRTFIHPEHIQQPMIEKIVGYFRGEQPNPCTIDEAVVLMKIMDAFCLAEGSI